MPAKGSTALYRPVPVDFDVTFIRVGWTSIEIVTRAHAKTIKKWIAIRNSERVKAGGLTLQQARAEFVRRNGPAESPAKANYALQVVRKRQRMTTVSAQGVEA